jgi:hypothetical protein
MKIKIRIKIHKYSDKSFEIYPVGVGYIYVRGTNQWSSKFTPDMYKTIKCMKRFAERFWK